MLYFCGLTFHEKEVINLEDDYICHPQGISKELIGVPLRACAGIQTIYNKKAMEHVGVTFYAPPQSSKDNQPIDILKYVLACADGQLKAGSGNLMIVNGDTTYVYTNLQILKSGGSIKKGQIIGITKDVPSGYGYGVNLSMYKGDKCVNINNLVYNIINV